MTDNLPPLPPCAPEFKPRWPNDPGGYTADQMQAYALAAIEKDRERQSVTAPQDAANLLARYERQWHRMGELWERHQGKGWPDKESAEFQTLRDKSAPATRAALLAMLYTSPQAAQSAGSTTEDVAKVARNRGLDEALGELALMYDKAGQASPLHKGMRMALSSAYDRVKALMQSNTQAPQPQPVQQETCPECDGTGTVAGSQAHFPCPLCTSPQAAQPQPGAQDHYKELAALGWQAIECPVCGSSAQGYPRQAAQPLSDEQKQEIHHETGAGHALISLVESYITKGTT